MASECNFQSTNSSWHPRAQNRLSMLEGIIPHFMPSEHMLTAIVMDRLCAWGEHRTASEWPPELVAPGPIPSVVDALLSTRTRSLTLPQLITAIKERTGGGACGKALDMLNLKAYIRCFPTLFVVHSGRTAAGRPLDSVELRTNEAMAPAAAAATTHNVRIERHALAVSIASNAWNPQQQSLSNARQRAAQPADAAARCLAASQPSSHTQTQHAKTQPSIALPRISAPALEMPEHGVPHMRSPVGSLPSKELFAAPAPAAPTIGYGGAPAVGMAVGSPRALEAPASVDSSLWGASPAQAPAFNLWGATSGERSADCKPAPSPLLRQIEGLFYEAHANGRSVAPAVAAAGPAVSHAQPLKQPQPAMERRLDAPAASTDGSAITARESFIRQHDLDRIFQQAVDRAMLHNVPSPVQFIAHELLRTTPGLGLCA